MRITTRLRTLAALAALTAAPAAATAQAPRVTIDSGELAGARDGATEVFKGIPFGASTAGPMRWRPPARPASWRGVRDATRFGDACPQGSEHKEAWAQVGPQSEDCLYLNVWRPARPGRYPVMVYIYGGGFTYGAASVPLYNGKHLAERGAVIVTFNYRVGRFGFFAHPALTRENPAGPLGNYGVMDQIAALQWVQRNIARFGGDAGNVTVFGESAGAGSVQILMATPAAKGLFAKAISESGAGNSVLPPIRGGAINAETLGQLWSDSLGLKNATAAQLRAVPVADVIRNGRSFPFIDGTVVVHSPGEPFYRGTEAKVPLIIGGNSNESSLGGMTEAAAKALLGEQFPALLQGYVTLTGKPPAAAAVSLAEQAGFLLPSYALADRHAANGAKAYAYYFDQVPVELRATAAGTDHGGEVEYVFGTQPAGERWDARDVAVAKMMGDYWVRFARTSDPNGGGAPAWPAVSAPPTTYLSVGATTQTARLQPVQEQAKAAAMADSQRKWPLVPQP